MSSYEIGRKLREEAEQSNQTTGYSINYPLWLEETLETFEHMTYVERASEAKY